MENLKSQLLTSSIESLVIAGALGFIAGTQLFNEQFWLAGLLLCASLFNVMNATARFDLYKSQK